MLIRTHLSITLFFVLLFISVVEYKFAFVLVALLATFILDVDSKFSTLGKRKSFRILQFFIKHRGIMHSFSFLILVTLFLVLFFPIISLGFFLGYGTHLLADSFTIQGVRLFYPLKKKTYGRIRTGKRTETIVFVVFLIGNLWLLIWKVLLLF